MPTTALSDSAWLSIPLLPVPELTFNDPRLSMPTCRIATTTLRGSTPLTAEEMPQHNASSTSNLKG